MNARKKKEHYASALVNTFTCTRKQHAQKKINEKSAHEENNTYRINKNPRT